MDSAPTAKRKRRRRRRRREALPHVFSTLPDDLILNIASRIPMRTAVSFSVLARRFRHLPTLFDRLDSISFPTPSLQINVKPPFLLRRLALSTKTWNARISIYRPVLAFAIDHGVTELSIRLFRRMYIMKNVFSILSLAVLSLDKCTVPRSSGVSCASLRTLKLTRVSIPQEILTAVLASASSLETLEMVFCSGFGDTCTVKSSTVRNFVFRPVQEQPGTNLMMTGLMSVVLYTRPKMSDVQVAPAPKVKKVYLHVAKLRDSLQFNIRPFLNAGADLTRLTLRGFAMMLLAKEYKYIPKLPATYQKLRMLSVSLDFSRVSETVFVMKLLERCPSLQQLTISAAKKKGSVGPSFSNHKERLAKISCLTDLLEFNFLGFRAEEYQTELFVLILNRTRKLKKLVVQFTESAENIVKWILSIKKASFEKRSTKYNHCYMELEYP